MLFKCSQNMAKCGIIKKKKTKQNKTKKKRKEKKNKFMMDFIP